MQPASLVLQQARARSGLTQRELGERSGVPQSVISAYESGHRQPSLPMLEKLVAGTGLRIELDLTSRHHLPRHGLGGLLRKHRRHLRLLADKHGMRDVKVFGSAARGDDHPESDIDLLVTPPPGTGLLALGRFTADVEELLGARVDVVVESSLKPAVRRDAERDAIPL
jgi:uncharacterized protein